MISSLQQVGHIDLPPHRGAGGFDHAAVHAETGRIFVAHTANDAIDVIDPSAGAYLFSIGGLRAVAGALVSDELQLVFTSNRGENTIGIFAPSPDPEVCKVAVGVQPNGLACDPTRGLVLVANVGDPRVPRSHTLTMVRLKDRTVIAEIPVPGRTRWAVHDPEAEVFYVNIADPPEIAVIESRDPTRIARSFPIAAAGPHGLDLDPLSGRLFCACDAAKLVALDARSGTVRTMTDLSGPPDVIFFNATRRHLYVAVGDPGVIDVLDTTTMRRIDSVPTESGAHTLAFSAVDDRVYVFLPRTHRAAVFQDFLDEATAERSKR